MRRSNVDCNEIGDWKSVPDRVRGLFKVARPIARTVQRVAQLLPASPGYGYVYFHPEKRLLHAVLGDGDDNHEQRWHNALKAIKGIQSVRVEAETHPKDADDWVLVKRSAAPLGFFGKPMEWAGKLTGGPSPLSNALVGALMTGGLGYGTGWLLEHLFPERFVERGRLRRTLGTLGAVGGAAIPAWQWRQNYLTSQEAGPGATGAAPYVQSGAYDKMKPGAPPSKPLGVLGALLTPTNKLPVNQAGMNRLNTQAYTMGLEGATYDPDQAMYVGNERLGAMREWLGELPEVSDMFARSVEGLLKVGQGMGAGGVGLRAVPMDAFNRAIWNDVRMGMTASRNPYGTKSPWGDNTQQMHTPPQLGAAVSGLATGVQQMYGNQSVLSPKHFVRGLATAGVDLATAKIVGGVLGSLGGLTPLAQKKLQDVGVWGGLIRGTVGSMLGF
jgi:hypothetical protein